MECGRIRIPRLRLESYGLQLMLAPNREWAHLHHHREDLVQNIGSRPFRRLAKLHRIPSFA